jgi:beta-mannosidase
MQFSIMLTYDVEQLPVALTAVAASDDDSGGDGDGGGALALTVVLQAAGVRLWWPRGMGSGRQRVMYTVNATFVPSGASSPAAVAVSAERRIGFRTAYLTTGNDTDAAWVAAHRNGNGNANPANTVMWRINGAPTMMRGGNLIPMEEMEGRVVQGMHRQLVKSAAAGNMNLIRVWGGGIYPLNEFSDTCDEEGVMIFLDLMYAQGGHGATEPGITAAGQDRELRHQIRRQSHHPSIIGFSGCNECEQTPAAVMDTVAQEDSSRVIRGACPFGLYTSGVHTLTGLPNDQPLRWIQNWRQPGNPAGDNCDNHALWCNATTGVPWQGGAEQHGPCETEKTAPNTLSYTNCVGALTNLCARSHR